MAWSRRSSCVGLPGFRVQWLCEVMHVVTVQRHTVSEPESRSDSEPGPLSFNEFEGHPRLGKGPPGGTVILSGTVAAVTLLLIWLISVDYRSG